MRWLRYIIESLTLFCSVVDPSYAVEFPSIQGSFVDVVSLEQLDLSKNRLTELKRSALHRLPRLRTVDLSHNQIRSFHSDAFKDTPQASCMPCLSSHKV